MKQGNALLHGSVTVINQNDIHLASIGETEEFKREEKTHRVHKLFGKV